MLLLFVVICIPSLMMLKKFNTEEIFKAPEYKIQIPTYTTQKNGELEILPSNFEDTISKNNIDIDRNKVQEILLTANISIEKPENFIPASDSILLLSTKDITQYFLYNMDNDDMKIQNNIDRKLKQVTDDVNRKAQFLLPVVSENERSIIKDALEGNFQPEEYIKDETLNKLLTLSDEKERFLSIVSSESILSKSTENVNFSNYPNPIYLEENDEYYKSLLGCIEEKRDNFESLGVYDGEYEELINDMNGIINKDSSVYSKMLSFDEKYILLHTTKDNILTISTTDKENEYSYDGDKTMPVATLQPTGAIRIPVIMYHQIVQAQIGTTSPFELGLYLPPVEFEKQVAYLTKEGYKTISSEEFSNILERRANPSTKSIMLTFDDGTTSHYTSAYRILKKYQQIGTFFVITNRGMLSREQIKEMSDGGMDIQSHTETHPDLVKLNDLNRLYNEVGGSKSIIEGITGKPVIAIAYPGCVADTKTFNAVASYGYKLGFSCGKSIDHRYQYRLSLSRIHNTQDIDGLKKILSGIYPF